MIRRAVLKITYEPVFYSHSIVAGLNILTIDTHHSYTC